MTLRLSWRFWLTFLVLLVPASLRAEPVFHYGFVVESVTCTSGNVIYVDGVCPSTAGFAHDLGTLLVTLSAKGPVHYELLGAGPSPIPLPFVNDGFLDFVGSGGVDPIFYLEAPENFNFIGGTYVDVFASNVLSGVMSWFTTEGGIRMSGGETWSGSMDSDRYFWPHIFTGHWRRVPEPAMATLLGFSLAGLAFVRRHKIFRRTFV